MIIALLWLLIGSVLMNLLWILKYQKVLSNFDYWKKEKNRKYKDSDYTKGFIYGLLCGPTVIKSIIRFEEEKDDEQQDDHC